MRNGLIHADRLAERLAHFGVFGTDMHGFTSQPDQGGRPEYPDLVKGHRKLGPRLLAFGERTAGGVYVPSRQSQAAQVAARDRRLPVRPRHVQQRLAVESQHRVGDRAVDEKLVAHRCTAGGQRHDVRSGQYGRQQLFFTEASKQPGRGRGLGNRNRGQTTACLLGHQRQFQQAAV